MFACDFDLTCTARDTCATLAAATVDALATSQHADEANATQMNGHTSGQESGQADGHADGLVNGHVNGHTGGSLPSSSDGVQTVRQKLWDSLTRKYAETYSTFMVDIDGTPQVTMEQFFARLAVFEASANERLAASAALAGVTKEQLVAAAEKLEAGGGFREACGTVLARMAAAGVAVNVVSVSWSGTFVRAAVEAAMRSSKAGRAAALAGAAGEEEGGGGGEGGRGCFHEMTF